MFENWNKDVTVFLKTEKNKVVQWEKRVFSRCFFRHIRSSEFDEKSRICGESYIVRIPCKSAPKITQGCIAVLGNIPVVIEEGASGNDIFSKYGKNAFKVGTISDNTDFFKPHIRIGN
jgi:hypothetical protein